MGGKIPVLRPREVIKILEAMGFTEVRQRGSHKHPPFGRGIFEV